LDPRARSSGFAKALLGLLGFALVLWLFYLTRLHRLLPAGAAAGWRRAASYCLLVAGGLAFGLGILTAPWSLGARPWMGRLGRGLANFLGALLLVSAYVDVRTYEVLGVHLYDPVVLGLLGRGSLNQTLHITFGEIFFAAAGVVAMAVALAGIAWAGERLGRKVAARAWWPWALLVTLVGLPLFGWLGSRGLHGRASNVETRPLPLYQLLFSPSTARPASGEAWTLNYPRTRAALPTLRRRPNYLLLLAETLRGDMLDPQFMPETWRLQGRPHCARSASHQSVSHSTDHCLFSLLYGLYSYHYQILGRRNVPSYPFRVLKQNGYRIVGGSSAPLAEWGEVSYLTEQMHVFYEAKGAGPVERDRDLVRWAEDFLSEQNGKEPFFLVVFLDATHHKYYYPPEFERWEPVLPESHSLITGNERDPQVRQAFVNRYKNSVRFVDHNLARLLQRFEALQKGRDWIAAVTGDHGEEFWDHGLLGHASVGFVNARVRLPLVLCASDVRPWSLPLTSHVDLIPTFLDYAGLDPPVPAGDYSQGVSLLRPEDPGRWVADFAIEFPEKNRDLVLVSQTTKFLVTKQFWGNRDFQIVGSSDAEDNRAERSPDEAERALAYLNSTYRSFFLPAR
jgi:membrane-anchored protein YejM (alkaline phosphatase superfamily)